jgi:putative FmdB family regulatory protein
VRHDARAVPTYDYQCRSCGSVTEVIHSMLEEGPSTCERCGGQLRRMLYPTGIIFKGSGFYRTDSRNGGGKTGESTEKASPPASGSTTATPSADPPKKTAKGDASSD